MKDKSLLVGFFNTGTDGPQVWVKGDAGEGDFVLTLTMKDAWMLSSMLDDAILACINSAAGEFTKHMGGLANRTCNSLRTAGSAIAADATRAA